jgi:plasmid stabilization system protein ParE
LDRWGADQAVGYDEEINETPDTPRQPNLGRLCDDLLPGLGSHPVLSLTIFYRVENDILVVQRIVH